MTSRQVLISGGGIAGATLAYWLGHSGAVVTVVEKASAQRSSGNPVDVRGDATAIAEAMGIWPRLEAHATGVERLVFVDSTGRKRAVVATRRTDAAGEIELSRTALAGALMAAATDHADIVYGDAISGLHQDPGGVDVEFEHGKPRRFDLVIGADGLHSRVRRLVFGPENQFARPFGLYVATVRASVEVDDPHEVVMYNEPGRSLTVHPAGGEPGVAFIFRTSARPGPETADAGRELVRTTYAGGGWRTAPLLDTFLDAEDVYLDAVTRITMPRWHSGRVALVGDAASCLSLLGEGSSNAIAGAKSLADALGTTPDHEQAFAAYETEHRRRLAPFLRMARVGGRFLVPRSSAGIAVRNATLRTLSVRGR